MQSVMGPKRREQPILMQASQRGRWWFGNRNAPAKTESAADRCELQTGVNCLLKVAKVGQGLRWGCRVSGGRDLSMFSASRSPVVSDIDRLF